MNRPQSFGAAGRGAHVRPRAGATASTIAVGGGRSTPLDWLFWFVMLSVNLQDILELRDIETVFKPYRVASLLLGILAIPHLVKRWRYINRWMLPLLFAYSYAATMTLVMGGTKGLLEVIPLIGTSVALLISTCGVSSAKSMFIGCYCYIVGYALSCLLGIAFPEVGGRFSGLFHNPNYFGFASCVAIIFLMNPALRMPALVRVGLVAATFLFVFMSGSRGSAAAAVLAGGTQIVSNPRLFAAMVFLGICGAVGGLLTEGSLERFEKANQEVLYRYSSSEIERGGSGRIAVAKAGLITSYEHAFVGIGLDQFRKGYYQRFFRRSAAKRKGKGLGLHNAYMSLLTEWGLPAFLAIALAVSRLFSGARHAPQFRVWIRGFVWSILVLGLGGAVINTPHFWLLCGFCVQLLFISQRDSMRSRAASYRAVIQNPVAVPGRL